MKKQLSQKLTLNKETLRNLSDRDLKNAVGGVTARCTTTDLCTESCDLCGHSLLSRCC
ncbi:MAG TPA: class I lanthipeptide [Thermoanaerobaculia bacterium]|mgnify:CR=1 FL=1|nr:class I lanthipeptide [Thermoanaerobaculia bacterium]